MSASAAPAGSTVATVRLTPAAWLRRVLAELIDVALVVALWSGSAMGYAPPCLLAGKTLERRRSALPLLDRDRRVTFVCSYHAGKASRRTLGKRVVSVAVIRHDRQPIGYGRAVRREVVVKTILFGLIGWLSAPGSALRFLCFWQTRSGLSVAQEIWPSMTMLLGRVVGPPTPSPPVGLRSNAR